MHGKMLLPCSGVQLTMRWKALTCSGVFSSGQGAIPSPPPRVAAAAGLIERGSPEWLLARLPAADEDFDMRLRAPNLR